MKQYPKLRVLLLREGKSVKSRMGSLLLMRLLMEEEDKKTQGQRLKLTWKMLIIGWIGIFSNGLQGKKGFGEKWMGWIMGCLDHPHYSIMINETSKWFFKSPRGLRQGDPLLPFLFFLVVNTFSVLMLTTEEVKLIRGFDTDNIM